VIGAVGVSGVKSNEDAQIAKAGIAALGLWVFLPHKAKRRLRGRRFLLGCFSV